MSDHEPTIAELLDALRAEVDVVRDAQQKSNADKLAENKRRLRRVAQSIRRSEALVRSRRARLRRGE